MQLFFKYPPLSGNQSHYLLTFDDVTLGCGTIEEEASVRQADARLVPVENTKLCICTLLAGG